MRGKTHLAIGVLSSIQASIIFNLPLSIFNILLSAVFSLLPDLDASNSLISNMLVKHKFSKIIYRTIILTINTIILILSINFNENLFIGALMSFIAILILDFKLSHFHLRKLLISLIFFLLALCLYINKLSIYIIFLSLIFAIFPWLKHRSFSHSLLALIFIYILLRQIEFVCDIPNLAFFGSLGYFSHLFLGDIFTKAGIPIFYPISSKKISFGKMKVGSFISNVAEALFIILLVAFIVYTVIQK